MMDGSLLVLSPRAFAGSSLDVGHVRAQFPILERYVHGKPLVYLDNGASAQTPLAVVQAMNNYYGSHRANIHRGVHLLSQEATEAYDAARATVANRLHADSPREIVFVRGTTEAINLVAYGWGDVHLQRGDEVLITTVEHHANIVPWQRLCQRTGAVLKVVPVTDAGEVTFDAFRATMSERTSLAAFAHVSNVTGAVLPVQAMIDLAREKGVVTLVDGAQAVPHMQVDVKALGCDFYVFSGHKCYGPTGVGVLYGRLAELNRMEPWQTGGDMIDTVSFTHTTYAPVPQCFEAGTPDIAAVIGLAAAFDWAGEVGLAKIEAHDLALTAYLKDVLSEVPGVQIVGATPGQRGAVSFTVEHMHPHDVGTLLDLEGIAVRTGHHCAMPLMQRLGLPATARASVACYNTADEIDSLGQALRRIIKEYGR